MATAPKTLSDKIHADTKAKFGAPMPVAVIQRFTEIGCDESTCPTSMFDWVGFDCYGPLEGPGRRAMPLCADYVLVHRNTTLARSGAHSVLRNAQVRWGARTDIVAILYRTHGR